MSQGAVEKALGKLVTDESFRERFFRDPSSASFYAGLELSREELNALSRLPKKALDRFSQWLDDRICRLPLDEDQRSAPAGMFDEQEGRPPAGHEDAFGAAQCARKGRVGSSPKPLVEAGGLMDSRKNPQGAEPAMNTTGDTKEEQR